MDSLEYQVTIKSANQKVDDYVTHCRPAWTVHRLKQHISETHVNKPSVADQRLIYAGNLLKDSHTLKQIFFRDSLCTELPNSDNRSDFTIHLVCHTPKPVSNQPASDRNNTSSRQSAASSPSAMNSTPLGQSANQPTSSSANTNNAHGTDPQLAHNLQHGVGFVIGGSHDTIFGNLAGFPSSQSQQSLDPIDHGEIIRLLMQSDPIREQLIAFQQLAYMVADQMASAIANSNINSDSTNTEQNNLGNIDIAAILRNQATTTAAPGTPNANANQLLSQMSLAAALASNRLQATVVAPSNSGNPVQNVHQNDVANQNNVADQPAPAPVAPVVADPEGNQEHDVIDWVYYFVRMLPLVLAIFLSLSVARLMMIIVMFSVFYFFGEGRRRPGGAARQPRNNPNVIERRQPVAQADQGRNVNDDATPPAQVEPSFPNAVGANTVNNLNDNRPNEAPNDEAIQNAPHTFYYYVKMCYLVLTDFVTSMMPGNPDM